MVIDTKHMNILLTCKRANNYVIGLVVALVPRVGGDYRHIWTKIKALNGRHSLC